VVESSALDIGLSAKGAAEIWQANDGLLDVIHVDTGIDIHLSSVEGAWSQSLMVVDQYAPALGFRQWQTSALVTKVRPQ
jgi:hypothetical protein